jgi:hypothetical protein
MSFASKLLTGLLVLSALATSASAQTKPSAKPKSGAKGQAEATGPAAPADPRITPALLTLQAGAADLPAGLETREGVKCISEPAQKYFEDSTFTIKSAPVPLGRVGQSFVRGSDRVGSLMAFEYDAVVSDDTRKFLGGLFWGSEAPTAEHPEELLVGGRFLVVLSFPQGDETAAALKTQIAPRLAALEPHDWSALKPLMKQVSECFDKKDASGGIKLLEKNKDKVADYAVAQLMLGQLGSAKQDWKTAQAGYARAIELHDGGAEHLPKGYPTLWSALDGLGVALLQLKREDEAVPVLERCVAVAKVIDEPKRTAHSSYNWACALARAKHFDDSLAALTSAIDLDPACKDMAQQDPDFEAARKRSEFKKLLGG